MEVAMVENFFSIVDRATWRFTLL